MALSKSVAVAEQLRSQIINRRYKNGDKLPTENQLSIQYGVSRQTIRKALADLSEEHLISSVQGSGSYVTYTDNTHKKTMRIVVITSYISEYIFPSILRGIENTVSDAGYTLIIRATDNSIARERAILQDIIANPVDGIAVEATKASMPNPNVKLYGEIADKGIPIMMFNAYYPDLELKNHPHSGDYYDGRNGFILSYRPNVRHVVMNDNAGAYYLTEKMLDSGHTKIGAILKFDDSQGYGRYAGFLNCMINRNAEFKDANVLWYHSESKRILSWLIGNHAVFRECTAVLCYNDEIAQIVLDIINKQEDCPITAVYSFDRHLSLHSAKPVYTYSLGYRKEEMGVRIAKGLIDMIEGRPVDSCVLEWKE